MAWYNDIQPSSNEWSAIRTPTGSAMEGSLAPLFRNVHPMLGGLASGGPYNTAPVNWGLPLTPEVAAKTLGFGKAGLTLDQINAALAPGEPAETPGFTFTVQADVQSSPERFLNESQRDRLAEFWPGISPTDPLYLEKANSPRWVPVRPGLAPVIWQDSVEGAPAMRFEPLENAFMHLPLESLLVVTWRAAQARQDVTSAFAGLAEMLGLPEGYLGG